MTTPRVSNLSNLNLAAAAASPAPGNAPPLLGSSWEGLAVAAHDLALVKQSVRTSLGEAYKTGYVGVNLRPALVTMEHQIEIESLKSFGLLGRLALFGWRAGEGGNGVNCKDREEIGVELLPMPQMVLMFAIHSVILHAGFVCTGNDKFDFNQDLMYPLILPKGWVDDSGTDFSFKYRPKSSGSDKLVIKAKFDASAGVLTVSANDPYSTSANERAINLKVKDFVKSKAGEAPFLLENKEKELISVVEERLLVVVNNAPGSANSTTSGVPVGANAARRTSNLMVALDNGNGGGGGGTFATGTGGARLGGNGPSPRTTGDAGVFLPTIHQNQPFGSVPGGFGGAGDLNPGGGGGGMLFGPGNPQFDARFRGKGGGQGNVPGARFDPYGPPGPYSTVDPDNDELPPPKPMPNKGSGGGGRGFPGNMFT